jgi:hypothetical protein
VPGLNDNVTTLRALLIPALPFVVPSSEVSLARI